MCSPTQHSTSSAIQHRKDLKATALIKMTVSSIRNRLLYHARAEEPSDAIPHVIDELREAVQACDDDKANSRRYTYSRFCDDSKKRPVNRQIMK